MPPFPHFLTRYTDMLNLPGFVVTDVDEDPWQTNKLKITVRPEVEVCLCPDCGGAASKVYKTESRLIRDLSQGTMETTIEVLWPHLECERCGCHFTPHFDGVMAGHSVTKRFASRLAEVVRISTVKEAAAFMGLAESTAEAIYYEVAKERVDGQPLAGQQAIRSIGIDEISQKKGAKGMSA